MVDKVKVCMDFTRFFVWSKDEVNLILDHHQIPRYFCPYTWIWSQDLDSLFHVANPNTSKTAPSYLSKISPLHPFRGFKHHHPLLAPHLTSTPPTIRDGLTLCLILCSCSLYRRFLSPGEETESGSKSAARADHPAGLLCRCHGHAWETHLVPR